MVTLAVNECIATMPVSKIPRISSGAPKTLDLKAKHDNEPGGAYFQHFNTVAGEPN